MFVSDSVFAPVNSRNKSHKIDFHIQKFTTHLLLNTTPLKVAQAQAPAAQTQHRLEELWLASLCISQWNNWALMTVQISKTLLQLLAYKSSFISISNCSKHSGKGCLPLHHLYFHSEHQWDARAQDQLFTHRAEKQLFNLKIILQNCYQASLLWPKRLRTNKDQSHHCWLYDLSSIGLDTHRGYKLTN